MVGHGISGSTNKKTAAAEASPTPSPVAAQPRSTPRVAKAKPSPTPRKQVAETKPSPAASATPPKTTAQATPKPSPSVSPMKVVAETKPKPAPPPKSAADELSFPTAKPVPGKPGYVFSPYDPTKYVDISGYGPGNKVKDPYSGKIFLVP